MLLHVSGSQWYKNLPGVIQLYTEYAKTDANPLPLWCISPSPSPAVQQILKTVPARGQVQFFQNLDNPALVAAYSLARVFIVPSLAEGFGWPIIEAQACGCPVMTTDAPPMNEIGGPATSYLPLLRSADDVHTWAASGASTLKTLLALTPLQRQQRVAQGLSHAARFNADDAIAGYLQIYQQVLATSTAAGVLK
jgi:glycosyltransferase involved in cell wall biosynthesis